MQEKMNKDKWVDDIMDSTSGMRKAEPAADFYEQVLLKLNKPAVIKGVSMPLRNWAAAAILLLAVNISSIVYVRDSRSSSGSNTSINPLALQLQLESTYNY